MTNERERANLKTAKDRFLEKVEKTETCWLWRGSVLKTGYGSFWYKGKLVRAHRAAYEMFSGPIPEGNVICHSCDVRLCVNPDHLIAATQSDNINDAYAKGRIRTGPIPELRSKFCQSGRHELTPENITTHSDGRRSCKPCMRLRTRTWRENIRALKEENKQLREQIKALSATPNPLLERMKKMEEALKQLSKCNGWCDGPMGCGCKAPIARQALRELGEK